MSKWWQWNRNQEKGQDYYNSIAKGWQHIDEVEKLNNGLLLDGYFANDFRGFYLVFYDIEQNKVVRWLDEDYIMTKRYLGRVPQTQSDRQIEYKKRYNRMKEKDEWVSDVPVKVVGSKSTGVSTTNYPLVGKRIDSELRYFHDRNIVPGVHYKIKNNELICLDNTVSDEVMDAIEEKLLGEPAEIVDMAEVEMPLLKADIDDVRRVAFDIEVKAPQGIFPVPEKAEYKIHAVGVYDNHDRAILFLLGLNPGKSQIRKAVEKLGYKPEIRTYYEEKQLLTELFDVLLEYGIHVSFNGDNFDLPYLLNRAQYLSIDPPIVEGHYRGRNTEYHLHGGIHIDLYRFYDNAAVRLYAFGAKYQKTSLDDVAEGLLGTKKVEHERWYDEMYPEELIEYTITDVQLTMDLITFSDNLPWNLMIILMRVGKMSLTVVNRESISKWLLNWIGFEHERQGLLIPDKEEIREVKGGFDSESEGGKQFQGAIVLDPKGAGVFWDVLVADFASLYPSVIKKFNLSYETLRCNHATCESNTVPDLSHWVCTQVLGIMAQTTGFVRDARVRWFKKQAKQADKEASLANTVSAALKVFINASYGVFGSSSFDLFCPPVAESTTAYSRKALLESKRIAEEELNLDVLYGDTDSIFIHEISDDQFNYLKIWSVVELGIELGIDYRFRFLVLSGRKKNYFGITENDKLILKGLQVKKRNTAIFIQEMFHKVAEEMKKVDTKEGLELAKEKMVRIIQQGIEDLENGRVELAKLARVATLRQDFDEYKAKSAAVQAAIQVMDDNKQDEIKQGYQFEVVSIKPREYQIKTTKFSNFRKGEKMRCTVRDVELIENYQMIDIEKYKERIRKAFTPIFEPFEMEWETTVEGYESLDQFFEPAKIS